MSERRSSGRDRGSHRSRVDQSHRRDQFEPKPVGTTVLVEPNAGPATQRGGFANGAILHADSSDSTGRTPPEPRGHGEAQTRGSDVLVHEVRSVKSDRQSNGPLCAMPIREVIDIGPVQEPVLPAARPEEPAAVRPTGAVAMQGDAAPARGAEAAQPRALETTPVYRAEPLPAREAGTYAYSVHASDHSGLSTAPRLDGDGPVVDRGGHRGTQRIPSPEQAAPPERSHATSGAPEMGALRVEPARAHVGSPTEVQARVVATPGTANVGATHRVMVIADNAQSLMVHALPAGPLERSGSSHPPVVDASRGRDPRERVAEPLWPRLAVVGVQAAPLAERSTLSIVDEPISPRAEHFRLLRHRLMSSGSPRCFAVASPHDGTEAAKCASELALAYAEAERENVLLIDLDQRQRLMGPVLGVSAAHSFASQLHERGVQGGIPWRALSVHRDNLHVMPMDASITEKHRVRSDALKAALQELQQLEYGQIIVVCPQLLGTSDVAMFAGAIEGVLLTGRVGKTTGKHIRKAAQAVAPTRIIGVALLET